MFIENNQRFLCERCGKEVLPHPTSSRNHCNFCLTSKHVDHDPGDRSNACQGLMKPIGLDIRDGKVQIVYVCEKCGERRKNIAAPDDNEDKIIELSTKVL